jgi:hypothetical protein
MPDNQPSTPAPNWGPSAPAPQGWSPAQNPNWQQPPPGWNPPPHPMSFMARPGSTEMLSRLAKVLGLALIFVGLLVEVVTVSEPGSCFQSGSNCFPTNFPGGAAWGILVGKALFVVGLASFAMGALLKLRSDGWPSSGRSEEVTFVLADRRANTLTFLVILVMMFILLLTMNMLPLVP